MQRGKHASFVNAFCTDDGGFQTQHSEQVNSSQVLRQSQILYLKQLSINIPKGLVANSSRYLNISMREANAAPEVTSL